MTQKFSPEQVDTFDGVASVPCGDMLLVLWRRPARRERICRVAAWIDTTIERNPDSIVVCQFLLASASPPDHEGRVVAKREALRLAPKIRRAIMAPLGDSVWQNLVCAILRAAVLVAGHSDSLKVVRSEAQAIDSLTQVATELSANRQGLEAAVAALYAALEVESSGRVSLS